MNEMQQLQCVSGKRAMISYAGDWTAESGLAPARRGVGFSSTRIPGPKLLGPVPVLMAQLFPNIFWEILFPEFPLTYYDLTGMLRYKWSRGRGNLLTEYDVYRAWRKPGVLLSQTKGNH